MRHVSNPQRCFKIPLIGPCFVVVLHSSELVCKPLPISLFCTHTSEVMANQAATLILFMEVTHFTNRLLKSFRTP